MPAKYPSSDRNYRREYNARRYASDPELYAAKLAYQKQWYQANKQRSKETYAKYLDANRDKIKMQRAEEYRRNLAAHRARRKAYYWANRQAAIDRAGAWQKSNSDKYLANKRKNYHRPDGRKKNNKKYALNRKLSGKGPAYQRIYKKRIRQRLTNFYIRELLAKHSMLKPHQFPQQLVDAKREQLKLKQEIESHEKRNPATD